MVPAIEPLSANPSTADLIDLAALLRDAVEGGASVGFMLPLLEEEISRYWTGVRADVTAGHRLILAARAEGRVVGSVQLEFARRANSQHRAEVQKLLVLRSHRGRGIGSALLAVAEDFARLQHRTLLVLDTSSTGNAIGLYARCGYTRVGVIPRYAKDPDGPLIDTVVYYKELTAR